MPSQPLPLPTLSSSMFVPVHREGVPCWLLDSIKNELVSSECTPPSLVAMPCSVFLQHPCKLPKMLNQHIQADTKWAWLPESHDLVEENFLSKVSKFGGCS